MVSDLGQANLRHLTSQAAYTKQQEEGGWNSPDFQCTLLEAPVQKWFEHCRNQRFGGGTNEGACCNHSPSALEAAKVGQQASQARHQIAWETVNAWVGLLILFRSHVATFVWFLAPVP